MNVLPVIARELRAEARHPFTYWVRVFAAGAAFVVAVLFVLSNDNDLREGGRLLLLIHGVLHLVILLTVPLLTADCLSRERREGTLGLLFLTPLKARDIVIAKSLAHGLRGLTLLLAVVPVVTLPLLMGGVVWQQAAISVCLNLASVCLALSAGLVASAFCKSWVRSLVLAMCLTAVLAYGLLNAFGIALDMNPAIGTDRSSPLALMLWSGIEQFFEISGGNQPQWLNMSPGGFSTVYAKVFPAAALMLVLALGVLASAILFAARRVRLTWQDRPPHPFVVWMQAKFCQPVLMQRSLKLWMRRTLERNPIGWLERRTWSGRIVIWGWLGVVVGVYIYALGSSNYSNRWMHGMHMLMAWGLLLSMTFSASNSLRRERETRALELLLVSPLSEAQILSGRLRGLWGQFLPAAAMFVAGWTWLATQLNQRTEIFYAFGFVISFLSVPVIGLFFSLVCKNFLTALVWSVVVALVLPSLCGGAFTQLVLAVVLGLNLHARLVQRRFAMEGN